MNTHALVTHIQKVSKEKGSVIVLLAVIIVSINVIMIASLSSLIVGEAQSQRIQLQSKTNYYHAESALEDTLLLIKNGMSLGGSHDTKISSTLNVTTSITTPQPDRLVLSATGRDKELFRIAEVAINTTPSGISFPTAIISTNASLNAGFGGNVTGSVYSAGNGAFTVGNATINGDQLVSLNDLGTLIGFGGNVDGMELFYSKGAVTVGNADIEASDYVYSGGDLKVNSGAYIESSEVYAQGKVDMDNARIVGNLRSGGNVRLNFGARVNGDIYANGSVTMVNSANVTGDIWAGGAITCPSCSASQKHPNQSTPPVPGSFAVPVQPTPPANPFFQNPADPATNKVTQWKASATAGGIISGNCSSGCTLGPGKIIGNLSVPLGKTLTLMGPIYVTGNVNVGNAVVRISPSVGDISVPIVADGKISIGFGARLLGSRVASPNSSFVILATETSLSPAISMGNIDGDVIAYAPNGVVSAGFGLNIHGAIFGEKVNLDNVNVSADFDTSILGDTVASPSTFMISSWKETD
jgi:hypothetical protein